MSRSKFIFLHANQLFITLLLCLAVIGSSCTKKTLLHVPEKKFGTRGSYHFEFHRLVDDDQGTLLGFPGYIIGVEKSFRNDIKADPRSTVNKGEIPSLGIYFKSRPDRAQLKLILNDYKPLFLSSIVTFEALSVLNPIIRQRVLFSAYDSSVYLNSNPYQKGIEGLIALQPRLREQVKKEQITHIFIYSMGWNSDQQESVRNFSSLYGKLLDAAALETNKKTFNPLFIGITWPAYWSSPNNLFLRVIKKGISFFPNSNDADEAGITWANILVHKILRPVKEETGVKVIAVGHSFGAKLMSRAVFSEPLFKEKYKGKVKSVDLFIGLESAFSINRFLSDGKGMERNPYRDYSTQAGKAILVTSMHDKATNKGFHAPFAGSYSTYRKFKVQKYPSFDFVDYQTQDNFSTISKDSRQILYINASTIIRKPAYYKGGLAHSDIYTQELAEMTWKLVKRFTL